jgi:uncharacterized membrane protein YdfJ with MMPL/SSD domain
MPMKIAEGSFPPCSPRAAAVQLVAVDVDLDEAGRADFRIEQAEGVDEESVVLPGTRTEMWL